MGRPTPDDPRFLTTKARHALGMTQGEFGAFLGVSRRTVSRWNDGLPTLIPHRRRLLVQRVHPRDPALASALASAFHETLESLGVTPVAPAVTPLAPVVTAPPPPVVSSAHLADSVVCAAAEAVGLAPQAIRPALVAAFERAAAVGLSVDAVRSALQSAPDLAAPPHLA